MPSTDPFQPLTPTGEVDRAVQGLKVPPHSIEAEQSVLGALLLDNSSWDWVAPILREVDFYRSEHAIIFQIIGRLVNDNKPADVLTVHEELKATGLAENFGITYLNQLTSNTPSAANIRGYAQIISDRSILRRLIQTADGIANSAFDPEGKAVKTLLDEAESRILAISQDGGRTADYFEIDTLMTEAIARIEELQARGGSNEITGIATGFIDLDKKTSGLQKGDLIIVAGRPSMGKAQPLDANIKTLTGWKKMQDMMVGDQLASIDGAPSIVTGIYPQGMKEIYEVVFSDGRKTQCCAEHLWRVHHDASLQPEILTTAELIERFRWSKANDYFIDAITGDFGHQQILEIDPWALGFTLGCMRNSTMNEQYLFKVEKSSALQVIQEVLWQMAPLAFAERVFRPVQGKIGCWESLPKLRVNARSTALSSLATHSFIEGCRHIPSQYLLASKTQRWALLKGWLEGQGFDSLVLSKPSSEAILVSVDSFTFAHDIAQLVRSLGGACQIHCLAFEKKTPASWQLKIHLPQSGELSRIRFEKIAAIRRAQAQCISVSHPSHTYITDDYVVTHNTSFAMNIAENVAIKEGLPVLVFSMEMGAAQLATRMLGSVGRVNQGRLRTGNLNDEEWHRFTDAIGQLSKAPMLIDETGSLSSLELRARARRMARKYGKVGLIVIDYLQLMAGKGGSSSENRATEISEISRSLKSMAKEMGCPVIALSQLNRSLEGRENKRPIMSDLRECVVGETLVMLADGSKKPIKELVGLQPKVLVMNQNQQITTSIADCVWSVGIKPVIDVELQSGRHFIATQEHRVYTQQGWQTIAQLQVGQGIATRSNQDISWEPIVSIQPAGEQEVFDLTVPEHGSWLANDIVSHNSGAIEQDADVIIFIYRDSVYNPETERPGVAEIIIGKQRNGPIGTVELSWQGEYTKFDNLALGYQSNPFSGNSGNSNSSNVPF